MKTVDAALALLGQIETIVNESNPSCEVKVFQVTAGTPADPSSQTCPQISVWASQLFNAATTLFHDDNPCMVVRGVQLNWRISVCYQETEKGRTAEEHLVSATCLYDLADAVWCGLAQTLKTGFLGLRCADIKMDPLSFDDPFGGYVNATSGVRFQLDCESDVAS